MTASADVPRHRSVIESKVRAPRSLGAIVQRRRLVDAMAEADRKGCVYTLVTAPAGAGKTMLMTQRYDYVKAAQVPVGWLSVDPTDNDPGLLWTSVLASCAVALREHDVAAADAFASLPPPRASGDRAFLTEFCASVERLPDGLHLVLDDVHELESADVLSDLRQLLRSAPPRLNVMLGCRVDPQLPIPRLILEGRAWEIRAHDLAFDRDETRELLAGHGVDLAEHELELLLSRTEGWVAGLRLAAMSLRHQSDPGAYVASFAGDDRPVMDYLMTEVLASKPAKTVSLLLATAVPDVVTAELAAELSGRPDAGRVLDGLARESALIHRAGSTPAAYRFHPLLRGFLRAELSRRDADEVRRIHCAAADWYADRGAPATAFKHAAEARDWDRVAEILDRQGVSMLMAGHDHRVADILLTAPPGIQQRPGVALVAAMDALHSGRLSVAGGILDRIGRDPLVHADWDVGQLHAAVLSWEARLSGLRDPQAVARLLAAETSSDRGGKSRYWLVRTAQRGMLRMFMGEFAAAEADLRVALRIARREGLHALAFDCLAHLAGCAAGVGDFASAAGRSSEALTLATERGWPSSSRLVLAYLAGAWAAWQRVEIAAAERYVALAKATDADIEPELAFAVTIVGLFVEFEGADDRRAVLARVRTTWDTVAPDWIPPSMVASFSLVEIQLALSIAEPTWAADAADRAEQADDPAGDVHVMRAWIHLYHHRWQAARKALEPVLSGERPCRVVCSEITACLLEAHLAAEIDDGAAADSAIVRAVELAAPRSARRDLVNASSPVRDLLIRSRGRFGSHEPFVGAVHDMTQALTFPGGTVAGEAFTARELEMLRALPSMLSQEEIARHHLVSVNTVKTHLKGLYRKLGVGSRREAVERARDFGLI